MPSSRNLLAHARAPLARCLLPLLLACLAPGAAANNGLNLSGYGGESEAMGGADVAIARDTIAVNTNPAGLAQTQRSMLDIYAAPWVTWNTHTDVNGNRRAKGDGLFGGFIAAGYARRFDGTRLTAGIGLFVQGGTGFIYEDIRTPFSNAGVAPRDEISSTLAIMKLAPALAWNVNEHWRVGAALGINSASSRQNFLLHTSSPGFQGSKLRSASGIGYSGRFGLQYSPRPDLTIGLVYGTRTGVPLRNGRLAVNYSADGPGLVHYRNAHQHGLRLPQEVALGVAFRPVPRLLATTQIKWYDWSSVVRDFSLEAWDPDSTHPAVAPTIMQTSRVRLHDQRVLALGLAYDWTADTTLLAGYNYAKRALPDRNLSPLLSLIQSHHLMLGAKTRINRQWSVLASAEILPKQKATNPSDNPLFGRNMTETQAGIVFHIMASRRW